MGHHHRLRSRTGFVRHSDAGSIGGAIESLETRVMLAVHVAIDTSQQFQKIEGLGTSDSDAPALYESAAYQKLYYQDLGASMMRVPFRLDALEGPLQQIWSPVTLGSDIQADIALFNWQQADVQEDGALAAASKTYALDSFKLIGSLWTPPHWMKGPELAPMTGQPDGVFPTIEFGNHDSAGGTLVDTPDNLRQFALYVTSYVLGFQQTFGVPFYAISLQNELAFSEPYSSCVYTPQIYVDALKAVHDAFVQYGVTTKIVGPDDVGVGPTTVPWLLWRQMQYINAVRADPVAMADLSAYSIHGYADDPNTPGRSPTMWQQYETGRSPDQFPNPYGAWFTGIASDGKESWETENQTEPQTWAGALTMAENAQDALVIGNVSTWMYWQTSDGGPASDQTLTSGTDETTQKFAAAEQFFRYIRPDSYRVAATPSDPTGVYVSAFVQSQQQTLTTVLINAGTTDQTVNLSVGGVQLTSFNIDRRTDATDTFADKGPVPVVNGIATITLPAGAIVTLQGTIAPGVGDAGFEAPSVGAASYAAFAYDPGGSPWTFTGNAGVSGNGSGFTVGNPSAPEGSQVGFLQFAGSAISQGVTLAAGSYTLSFQAAQRVVWQFGGRQDFEVLVDGAVVGTFNPAAGGAYGSFQTGPFSVTAGSHTITFQGLDTAGGDNTAFIDNVQLTAVPTAPAQPADAGFESPSVGSGSFTAFAYDPTGTPWTFTGTAGVSGNDSGFTAQAPHAPEGTQVGFLQFAGSAISQAVSLAAGTYAISFEAAQRAVWQVAQQDFEVLIDGTVVGTFKPPANGTYTAYTTNPIALAAGTHTIQFLGLDTAGGDNTAFIDAVQVVAATTGSGQPANAGFETPPVGAGTFGAFVYDPTNAGWQFSGMAGISGNGSGFTDLNPNSPEGTQVAFLQDAGSSISQTVTLASGSYALQFQAAQRIAWQSGSQDFQVLVDGTVVGTFNPAAGGGYALYQTSAFAATAGAHTIEFLGLDTAGGDNTAFLDAVKIISD